MGAKSARRTVAEEIDGRLPAGLDLAKIEALGPAPFGKRGAAGRDPLRISLLQKPGSGHFALEDEHIRFREQLLVALPCCEARRACTDGFHDLLRDALGSGPDVVEGGIPRGMGAAVRDAPRADVLDLLSPIDRTDIHVAARLPAAGA